jgi:hypothetical protein
VKERWSEKKIVWLIAGAMLGVGFSYYWPAEPAFAKAVSATDKFSMCSVPTLVGSGDAIFVLDQISGRLLGAAYNPQARSFNQTYARNVAADFGIADNAEYVMVPASIVLTTSGGVPPAQGAIYVGEMKSGIICAYGFPFVQSTRKVPIQELVLLDKFLFRQSSN